MDKNTTCHSERSEESRHYVRNSFGKLAYGKGLIWILRFAQNDGQWEGAITKKISFTMADPLRGGTYSGWLNKTAFTMAEILLSLTIIGVVAAITLPSLTGNINERTWEAKRKALYNRLAQAIAIMPNLNGYGIGTTDEQTNSYAAKVFLTEGLSKVLKINNICDIEHLADCNISTTIKDAKNNTMSLPVRMLELNPQFSYQHAAFPLKNTYAAAFETANGDSVLAFYNPYCVSKDVQPTTVDVNGEIGYLSKQHICLNFVFDTNGKKGPNTAGKDIGTISALFSTDSSVVMVMPYRYEGWAATQIRAIEYCKNNNLRIPTLDEAISYYANIYLYGNASNIVGFIWTSTTDEDNSNNAWVIGGWASARYSKAKTGRSATILCIK